MQKRILWLAAILMTLSAPALSAQGKDWSQRPLEYQHTVTVTLSTVISTPKEGLPVIAHPIVRRLSSIPNVADLKITGKLDGGSLVVTFAFRTVTAFNEWNDSPATRELLAELKSLSPAGIHLEMAMNPGAIAKP